MSKTNFKKQIAVKLVTLLFAGLSLCNTACNAPKDAKEELDGVTYNSVGGTVNGLDRGGTVILQNNNGDEIAVSNDGLFIFPTPMGITNRYQVTVEQQPPGQICSVGNASGVITVVEITDVTVVCSEASHFVGFSVTGLADGATLEVLNNGTDVTSVDGDGDWMFPTYLATGSSYDVTIQTQPSGQTCVINNASGTVADDVTSVEIVCN